MSSRTPRRALCLVLSSVILTFLLAALLGACGRSEPPLLLTRGAIHDRNGQTLVASRRAPSVFVDPAAVANKGETANAVAKALSLPIERVTEAVSQSRHFAWIKRRASDAEARAVADLKLPGVGVTHECQREYPAGAVAANLLGFTGVDFNGLEGLERQYDQALAGQPRCPEDLPAGGGWRTIVREWRRKKPKPGADVHLTIDLNLQRIAEQALDGAMARTQARHAVALAMNPQTGEVLALAVRPTFDPLKANTANAETLRNCAVADVYEPGGSLMPVLLAAALQEGAPRAGQVDCENGAWQRGPFLIHDSHPRGKLTLAEVIKNGSNIGAAKLAAEIGLGKFHDYLRSFGFGTKTGVDLPSESDGIFRGPKAMQEKEDDVITEAYGQGIAVTAIQHLTAFNAVVNGGRLMKPFVVAKVVGADGKAIATTAPTIVRRVVSEETSRQAAQILVGVTQPDGTGQRAAVPGVAVAGKTGTAQKLKPGTPAYDAARLTATFVGAVPAVKPTLSLLIVIDEPQGPPDERYGGIAAAPVFQEIVARYRGQAVSQPASDSQPAN